MSKSLPFLTILILWLALASCGGNLVKEEVNLRDKSSYLSTKSELAEEVVELDGFRLILPAGLKLKVSSSPVALNLIENISADKDVISSEISVEAEVVPDAFDKFQVQVSLPYFELLKTDQFGLIVQTGQGTDAAHSYVKPPAQFLDSDSESLAVFDMQEVQFSMSLYKRKTLVLAKGVLNLDKPIYQSTDFMQVDVAESVFSAEYLTSLILNKTPLQEGVAVSASMIFSVSQLLQNQKAVIGSNELLLTSDQDWVVSGDSLIEFQVKDFSLLFSASSPPEFKPNESNSTGVFWNESFRGGKVEHLEGGALYLGNANVFFAQ